MEFKRIGMVGLGLIGGSIAKTLKRINPDIKIFATSGHLSTITEAYEAHIIENNYLPDLSEFSDLDLIFLCTPVQKNVEYLQKLKSIISPHCLITDVGSVKTDIHKAVAACGLESSFIGGHPMTGSEKTGFSSATPYLLENAYYIITPTDQNTSQQITDYTNLVSSLGSIPLVMNYEHHDYATAVISHTPHIIASTLVHLVAQLDFPDETMKTIAAGGFRDITRIASSSPVMWENICVSNKEQILRVLNSFSSILAGIQHSIAEDDIDAIYKYFENARDYRDSLPISQSGPIKKIFELYCDLIDEAGGIATISTILASNHLNIKNIGIIHNREFEEGVLHLEMYDETSLTEAIKLLRKYHYTVYER